MQEVKYDPKSLSRRKWKNSFNGGGKRSRTADLLHAMQALYQLSYTPTGSRCFALYCIKIKIASAFSKKNGVQCLRPMELLL